MGPRGTGLGVRASDAIPGARSSQLASLSPIRITTLRVMPTVLLVADQQSLIDRVHAALSGPDLTVIEHRDPETCVDAAFDADVDSVLVHMRVGSMGAMAVTRALRAAAGDRQAPPVTILLDREADAFIAGRSGAANWLPKDASSADLRSALSAARAGT